MAPIVTLPPTPTEAVHTPFNKQQNAQWFQRSVGRRTEIHVEAEVAKLTEKCRFFQEGEDDAPEDEIAMFHRNEVRTCTILGNGAFSEVYQVWGFQLANIIDPFQEHARELIQQTAIDANGKCRYVIKHLRHDLASTRTKFHHAAADLVLEAKFLSKLDHPNIIKLRGWSGGPASYQDGTHDGFFLILDRLDETLSQRILRWRLRDSNKQNIYSSELRDHQEKLHYGLQIASALDYLHDRDIIFRDLKPDNIGIKGDHIQIFDFGLCRELPEEHPNHLKAFHMSGVGTRRYMAPEVFMGEHYNMKADVYSWTIVFHAMLSLEKPFENYNAALHRLLVCQEGVRPTIFPEWPAEIQTLCKKGWARAHTDRPTIKQVCSTLQAMLKQAEQVPTPAPGEIIERSIGNFVEACSANLCEEVPFNKHIITLLRLVEMNMLTRGATPVLRHEHTTEYPNLQHLRSCYL